jgi:hypothetical protein
MQQTFCGKIIDEILQIAADPLLRRMILIAEKAYDGIEIAMLTQQRHHPAANGIQPVVDAPLLVKQHQFIVNPAYQN